MRRVRFCLPFYYKRLFAMPDYVKLDTPAVLSLLFHPGTQSRQPPPSDSIDLDIAVDGAVLGCRFHQAGKDAPTILYFHGNGECVADYDGIAGDYVVNGINLLVTTYRGYGWSTGTPTVSDMMDDAAILFEKAASWLLEHGYTEPIFVMGRSLGSAPAIDIAARLKGVRGLIVESGFADTLPLVKTLGLDLDSHDISESDGFCNREKIGRVTLPTLLLHGARDEIIPVAMAEKLQADSGARSKQFMVIPGATHNTMIETGGSHYFAAIKNFMDTVLGKNTWRDKRRRFQRDRAGK